MLKHVIKNKNMIKKITTIICSFAIVLNVHSQESIQDNEIFEIAPIELSKPFLPTETTPLFKKYEITNEDVRLISENPPYSLKRYETIDGSSVLDLPVLEMRNFVRKGVLPDGQFWIVYFTETYPDHFLIKGTNSQGEKINQFCGKLFNCFPLL